MNNWQWLDLPLKRLNNGVWEIFLEGKNAFNAYMPPLKEYIPPPQFLFHKKISAENSGYFLLLI